MTNETLGGINRFDTATVKNLAVTGNETIAGNLVITGTLTAPSIIGSLAVASGVVGTPDDGTTQTLTAAMVTGSGIFTTHLTTGGTTPSLTMPLATGIIAANPGWAIGDSYTLRVLNTNSGTATIVTNTGITLTGTATIPTGGQADFIITMTAAATISMVRVNQVPVTLDAVQTLAGKTLTTPVIGAATGTSVSLTGLAATRSGTAAPASAGAVAAGPAFSMFSNGISLWVTSDAPAFSATKGDICINLAGSSSSTRLFINNGTTSWVAITTAS